MDSPPEVPGGSFIAALGAKIEVIIQLSPPRKGREILVYTAVINTPIANSDFSFLGSF